jgi:hypothetical protein
MALHRIVVVYAAPVPVGHRVEVRWLRTTTRGLFGESHEERPAEPAILDFDTGIEWASDHAYQSQDLAKHPDQPLRLADTTTGEVTHLLRGVVRSCRVLHIRRFSQLDVQTELSIDDAR